ncbi:MAG TPA: glycoside hydrolase family 13 protein [Bacteroidales bacterium]|nr:glycoside hydrolase family 13 protein [Bacteroidales bacterium]
MQLLVYGPSIADTRPSVDYAGITVANIQMTTNPNYLFITLHIEETTKPVKFNILFKKDKKIATSYEYQLLPRQEGSAERKSFSSADVIYLMMPDRFSNGNTANDSSLQVFEKAKRSDPNGRHGGDLQGIINHLDYLNDLGVTAIWNTPVQEDNMETYSYHTYAITDYYKIDPRYGTNADYKRLGDELHKRNMKLIMDLVPNHCGLNHWWMKDLPSADWVHQFPQFTRSNYRISAVTDPYASNIDKKINAEGWFDYSMPDLNQDNPLLLTYLAQNVIWWIEYAGVDGLRVDTYPYNDVDKAAKWLTAIRNEYPNLNVVGECWQHNAAEIAYWQTGARNADGFDSKLPSVMDFALTDALHAAFNEQDGWNTGLAKLYFSIGMDYVYPNPYSLMIFGDNHDMTRFANIIGNDIKKYKMAMAFLFTTRGFPQIYYGTEIMMTGDKGKGDGDLRKDFPGGWPGDTRDAFTSQGRTKVENDAFDFTRKLLNWRKQNPVIHSGKLVHFIPQDDCYVYFRYNHQKTVMVVLNNNNTEARTLDNARFAEMLKGFTKGHEVISGNNIDNLSSIEVAPKSAMIIELK